MYDIVLNKKLKSGELDAFSQLFKELQPRLKAYCALFIGDKSQIDDIIQDSFMSLWNNHSKINIHKSIESYIFVIVRNLCYRKSKEKQTNKFNSLTDLSTIELTYLYQVDMQEKRDVQIEETLKIVCENAINELPAKCKEVFIKNKIEGTQQKEIAKEMNVSIKSIEKYISQAKKHLRLRLNKDLIEFSIIILIYLTS